MLASTTLLNRPRRTFLGISLKLLWGLSFFLKRRYLIRVNYKTGIQEEFWTYWFWKQLSENNKITQVKWINVNVNQPFILGLDNIESVWIVKMAGIFSMPKSLEPKL